MHSISQHFRPHSGRLRYMDPLIFDSVLHRIYAVVANDAFVAAGESMDRFVGELKLPSAAAVVDDDDSSYCYLNCSIVCVLFPVIDWQFHQF